MFDTCPNCGTELCYSAISQYCPVCGYIKPYKSLYSSATTAAKEINNINRAEYDMSNLSFYDKYIANHLQTLSIDCSKIILHHKSLDIDIDISTNIDRFDEITVNGIRFRKEVNQ